MTNCELKIIIEIEIGIFGPLLVVDLNRFKKRRPTRWLAMTVARPAPYSPSSPGSIGRSSILEADDGIEKPRRTGCPLGPLHARGMTAVSGGEHPGLVVIARSKATKQSSSSWYTEQKTTFSGDSSSSVASELFLLGLLCRAA
jgi:hypothetical protein